MIFSKSSEHCFAACRFARCSSLRGERSVRLIMPVMPLIGVLISWLILARNCVLVLLAASAMRRASVSSFSLCLRLEISIMVSTTCFSFSFQTCVKKNCSQMGSSVTLEITAATNSAENPSSSTAASILLRIMQNLHLSLLPQP